MTPHRRRLCHDRAGFVVGLWATILNLAERVESDLGHEEMPSRSCPMNIGIDNFAGLA